MDILLHHFEAMGNHCLSGIYRGNHGSSRLLGGPQHVGSSSPACCLSSSQALRPLVFSCQLHAPKAGRGGRQWTEVYPDRQSGVFLFWRGFPFNQLVDLNSPVDCLYQFRLDFFGFLGAVASTKAQWQSGCFHIPSKVMGLFEADTLRNATNSPTLIQGLGSDQLTSTDPLPDLTLQRGLSMGCHESFCLRHILDPDRLTWKYVEAVRKHLDIS